MSSFSESSVSEVNAQSPASAQAVSTKSRTARRSLLRKGSKPAPTIRRTATAEHTPNGISTQQTSPGSVVFDRFPQQGDSNDPHSSAPLQPRSCGLDRGDGRPTGVGPPRRAVPGLTGRPPIPRRQPAGAADQGHPRVAHVGLRLGRRRDRRRRRPRPGDDWCRQRARSRQPPTPGADRNDYLNSSSRSCPRSGNPANTSASTATSSRSTCPCCSTARRLLLANSESDAVSSGASAALYDPMMVPEGKLEETEAGLVPASTGWFVMNARDARWRDQPGRGHSLPLTGADEYEAETFFPMLGMAIRIMDPGEPADTYHWATEQEDFLLLSGEALLIVEGQERRLKQWDFVHCPPETRHAFVGAGDGPCVLLCASSRQFQKDGPWGFYCVDETAARYNASSPEDTQDGALAYARFQPVEPARYRDGLLPNG